MSRDQRSLQTGAEEIHLAHYSSILTSWPVRFAALDPFLSAHTEPEKPESNKLGEAQRKGARYAVDPDLGRIAVRCVSDHRGR